MRDEVRETDPAEARLNYLERLCQRVRFNIFLCFFLRMRLRRFLINDPMASQRLADLGSPRFGLV